MYSLNAEGPRGKSDRVDGNMAGVGGGVEHQSGGEGRETRREGIRMQEREWREWRRRTWRERGRRGRDRRRG